MKNFLHNSLRALFLFLAVLLSLPMLAVEVEIDGINYELVAKIKQATVISGKYSGEVVIPESVEHEGTAYSVTSIGVGAFSNCYGLTSVTIPNSVTSIGHGVFHGSSGLISVTIGNSVTSIGDYAFSGCYGLTSVHISDIAAWCNIDFDGWRSNPLSEAHHLYLNGEEVKDLVIPNSVTSIGDLAFYECSGLTSVTIPISVKSIGSTAFAYCSGLTSVTIPNSVKSIGSSAFAHCSGLTSVHIPNSVTSIGNGAFEDCYGLTSVTIPNSVTSIGYLAFYECSGLTSVTIGNGVTSIGSYAFRDCSELLDVYCYAENVPSTESSAFDGSYPEYANLHVPAASIESYKTTKPWSSFGKIITLDAAILVESITLSRSSATMTEGETLNLTATVTPDDATDKSITWSSSNTNVASVDADGKVTAKAEGTATITATANDGSGVKASCEVTVEKKIILVNQITLSLTTATLTEGETITLTATVTPDDATDKSITWSSSNTNVASVDADGKVTAKAEGTTTITATANDGSGVKASCEVTVEKKVILVNQITLSQTTATLTEGETLTLTATVTPDYADNTSITWSSSNEEVALVSNTGKVVALMPGTATITATANDGSGVSASCVVTVNEIILGKCATPIISYADGQVSVTCETEDAKVVSTVAKGDDEVYEEFEFSLTPTYTITAYATKAQYENSDVATLTLCWIACTEEHEDEEETGLINTPAKSVLIQSHQGIITLSGLDAGTEVAAYNTSGAQLATAVATDGTATLYTNFSTGAIAIVKFGNKSVKIKI